MEEEDISKNELKQLRLEIDTKKDKYEENYFDEEDNFSSKEVFEQKKTDSVENNNEIYNAYFGFHPLIHPTCMFRRKLKDGTNFKYQIIYSANNDYYTFFKLVCQGYKFVNLKEKLIKYRIHGQNATFVDMREKFMNSLKIRNAMVANYGYIPSPKAIVMIAMQTLVVYMLPQKFLLGIYFLAKGIIRFEELIPTISISQKIPALKRAFSI